MPIPVIATDQGVLEAKQWGQFTYQPYATNSPTGWAWHNLPDGLEFDTVTGKVTGNATEAGTFIPYAIATNGSGPSVDQKFAVRIEESPAALNSPGYEGKFDFHTKLVSLVGGADLNIYLAFGDDLIFYYHCTKADAYLDLPATDIKLIARQGDTESDLITSSGWKKDGTGTGSIYKLHAKVSGSRVKGAVLDYEKRSNTRVSLQAEIQMTMTNPEFGVFGSETFTISSQRFPIIIGSEYVPNVA